MRCPSCQSDNADGSRFCGNCGTPFALSCPRCGRVNRAGSRFCSACGRSLAPPFLSGTGTLSFEVTIARLQKYLPEGITEKVLPQRDKIEGEKGTVNPLTAGGVIELFGVPDALVCAPRRVIRSARSIRGKNVRHGEKLRHGRGGLPAIPMRIVIYRGPVVVSTMGNGLRVEFKKEGLPCCNFLPASTTL